MQEQGRRNLNRAAAARPFAPAASTPAQASPIWTTRCCDFGVGGLSGGASPDRLDALVWAVTELTKRGEGVEPRIRSLDWGPGPLVPWGR